MDKIEFLKARLDELEEKAQRVEPLREIDVWGQKFPEGRSHARLSYRSEDGASWTDPDPDAWTHFDQWSPAFVLAQIAAQRAIVETHEPAAVSRLEGIYCKTCGDPYGWDQTPPVEWPCETITALLQPFAGRDDFPAEWKA